MSEIRHEVWEVELKANVCKEGTGSKMEAPVVGCNLFFFCFLLPSFQHTLQELQMLSPSAESESNRIFSFDSFQA